MFSLTPTRRRFTRWVLIDGSRVTVTTLVLATVLAALLVVDPLPTVTPDNKDPLLHTFSGFVAGNLGLLTIVLSINQLVFSRELMPVAALTDEIEAMAEYRREAIAGTDRRVPPVRPPEFLHALVDALSTDLETVERAADSVRDEDAHADFELFVDGLRGDLSQTRSRLEWSSARTLNVLSAMLAINLAVNTHRAQAIVARHGDTLPEEARTALDRILDRLEHLSLTRNHFKSLYTQESLSHMSRVILFVGIPAQVVAAAFLLWLVALIGSGAPQTLPPVIVYLILTVALAPLAVVFAYILRAATIARRTATTTQFTTQHQIW